MLKTSRWARPVMAAVTMTVAAVLTACSSAQSASPGGGTASPGRTAASGSATGSGPISSVVAGYEKAPTTIPITTPLKTSDRKSVV